MGKENVSAPKEPSREELEREFLMSTINKTHLGSYIPESFKHVITAIAIEMKKIQTVEEVFQKAGEFDAFMGNEDNKYEQTVRKAHQNYNRFSPTEAATLKYLKTNMAFDLAKGRLYRETETMNISVPNNAIIASSKFCVDLTTELDRTIIPSPKYL